MDQEIRFCTTPDGVRIAYAIAGAGPPLVKAANWLSHLEFDLTSPIWRHWWEGLTATHRLIRYDERGCGLSDQDVADFSVNAWVADLETVVDAVGLERFALLGVSQGGPVAITYAVRHPERVSHLILYGAYAQGWATRESAEKLDEREALLTLTKQGWGRGVPAYRRLFTELFAPDAREEEKRSFDELQRISTTPENAVRFQRAFSQIDVSGQLERVQTPTLVFHARADQLVPFDAGRELAAKIPNSRFVPLEGRNHILLGQEPACQAFLTEFRAFLGVTPGVDASAPPTDTVATAGAATPSLLERLRGALPGHYEIDREIASGGMGTVFLARDTVLERKVAVKVHRSDAPSESAAQRLIHEARILARLNHPNVVSVYHAGSLGDSAYYIMDYVEGETLEQRLARGPLQVDEAVKLGTDLLAALEAAHSHGVIHRDIKPSNVFLVRDRALLGDFGIAKRIEPGSTQLTHTGQRLGTPGYMPPEQIAGAPVTPATDIYAIGMLLYETLKGRHWSVLTRTQDADWSGIPRSLAAVVQRALALTPADRWPDAAAFGHALTDAAEQPRRRRLRWMSSGLFSRLPRLARLALMGLVAITVAAGAWTLYRLSATGPAPASASRVAVLPFSVRGSAEYAYLGEGMVDLLSTKLDGAGSWRAVDPRTVLSSLARTGARVPDPAAGRQIAEAVGAGLYVLGNIIEVDGRLRLDASLYDSNAGRDAVAEASAEGESTTLFELVDELAAELLVGRRPGTSARVARIAAVTTNSFPALKAYLEGEQAFRTGQFGDAVDAFERATDLDPAFALAWFRLSLAAQFLAWPSLSRQAAEQAVRYSDRLSERDRSLLQALLAERRGEIAEAEQRYRAVTNAYPDDLEAWEQLGELIFHYGPTRGRSPLESREAWQRVLASDPDHSTSLLHLARLAVLEGRHTDLDSLVRQFERIDPERARASDMRVLRAFASDDTARQGRVLAGLRSASDREVFVPLLHVGAYTNDPERALPIARLLVAAERPVETRALGHIYLAHLELARGRPSRAFRELDAAGPLDPALALEYRAYLALHPYAQLQNTEIQSIRAELLSWDADAVPEAAGLTAWFSVHNGIHAHLRAYLLGALSALAGDVAEAERYADQLVVLPAPLEAGSLPQDLALAVRARIALAQDRHDEALAALERAPLAAWWQAKAFSSFFSQSHERHLRAQLLEDAGRYEEALVWYGSFEAFSPLELIYLAPSHRRRAEIYAQLGQEDSAAYHNERFIELWRDADPELQASLDDAASRQMAESRR